MDEQAVQRAVTNQRMVAAELVGYVGQMLADGDEMTIHRESLREYIARYERFRAAERAAIEADAP